MKCQKCGKEIKSGSKFCDYCGNMVSNQSQGMNQNKSEVETSYMSETAFPSEIIKKKTSRNSIIIIALLVIAILICVVVLCYAFYNYGALNGYETDTDIVAEYDKDEIDEKNDEEKESVEEVEPEEEIEEEVEDYLFPSDSVIITEYDLRGKTQSEVAYIRNEIYARHGYIFNTEEYATYFSSKDWYSPNPYFDESLFNEIEKTNKDFIVEYEIKMGWR